MSALSDLQSTVDKIVASVDTFIAADSAADAAKDAKVADLTAQLATAQNDAAALQAMNDKLVAAAAKLVPKP